MYSRNIYFTHTLQTIDKETWKGEGTMYLLQKGKNVLKEKWKVFSQRGFVNNEYRDQTKELTNNLSILLMYLQ